MFHTDKTITYKISKEYIIKMNLYWAAVKKFLVCRHPGHPIRIDSAGR